MADNSTLPSRSALFSLPLLGRHTGQVESLTGYIARLADAHSVTPSTLLHRALEWYAEGRPERVGEWCQPRHLKFVHSINAHDAGLAWVRVLEAQTCQTDLVAATVHAWASHVPVRRLLRRHHAWCPCCYRSDQDRYDRLLWALAPVTVCPVHKVRLVDACPGCGSTISIVHPRATPGACPRCGTSLADGPVESECSPFEIWAADELAGLLANQSSLISGDNPATVNPIAICASAAGLDDAAAFSRAVGVSRITAWYWMTGKAQPDLLNALRVCFALGVSLRAFMTGTIPERLTVHGAAAVAAMPRRRADRFDPAFVSRKIQGFLETAKPDAPSLKQVAAHVGFARRTIRKRLPEISRQIIAAHNAAWRARAAAKRNHARESLRTAVRAAREDEMRMTRRSIGRHLSHPGILRSIENRQFVEQLVLELEVA